MTVLYTVEDLPRAIIIIRDMFAVELVRRWYDYWRERPGTGLRINAEELRLFSLIVIHTFVEQKIIVVVV